jgi:CopG family nickel-responsive transcriptional regulator
MRRITITLDEALADEFERYLEENGYGNRSEAVRDLVREKLQARSLAREPEGGCVAVLSYVYNHHERELSRCLTHAQHDHHDLAVSTLHVHLDHDNCLESVVLKGTVSAVRAFADTVMAQTGVRHGHLQLIPARIGESRHAHGSESGGQAHSHTHLQPIN